MISEILDKSWKESLVDKNSSIARVYLLGAGDFQRKAIEELYNHRFDTEEFEDTNEGILLAIELIKNLKYETKINSDS